MNPLATARQLWRLNKEGRLLLVYPGHGDPRGNVISAVDADTAIKASAGDGLAPARSQHS